MKSEYPKAILHIGAEGKHTPGPWSFELGNQKGTLAIINDAECKTVAVVIHHNSTLDEANARLIAAAPELLEACKASAKAMENDGQAWKHGVVELREAIAKAEGR